ncbi:MAG: sugar-binding domain-containing protein, partial [Salinibacter sp.]
MTAPLRTALLGLAASLLALLLPSNALAQSEDWQPADARLMTRWADDVSPETVKDRPYPRPQMKRARWKTLNGLWDYALVPEGTAPSSFGGEILVPFPVESALSGVKRAVKPSQEVVYRRTFTVPDGWEGERILLHFGAVDWRATVQVNGQRVGQHEGGYDPFTFDITDELTGGGEQTITVTVWDPTDRGPHPRGKQVLDPGGIWYTAVTGIWQTAWLEPVSPDGSIQDLSIKPDVSSEAVHLTVDGRNADGLTIEAIVATEEGDVISDLSGPVGETLTLPVSDPNLWSPSNPYLYELDVRLVRNGTVVDKVDSYFGMRSVGVGKGPKGKTRLTLNGEPLFQFGPLDQGYWPDGLYTAPTDKALAYDLEMTKELGFNMTRKHVKVEPRRWYYMADSLGLLVWQDMPSALAGGENTPEVQRSEADRQQFEAELKELVDDFYNHPSIAMWIVFNEGWGQYDTRRITQMVEKRDTTRLVSNASGWTDRGAGDVRDIHAYPGPAAPPAEEDRAIVLGEYGGRGLPVTGHTWLSEDKLGVYANPAETPTELDSIYSAQLDQLRLLRAEPGLSAAVYTQITDVEIEVNGLMTYDRDVLKMNTTEVAEMNRRLYQEPAPEVDMVAETAQQGTIMWRYTTASPPDGWMNPTFDADGWKEGPAGFGTEETPGAVVGTEWSSSDLWIRRTFTHEGSTSQNLYLRIHHDDAAEVYLNGEKIRDLEGWTTGYTFVELDRSAQNLLRQVENTLAVHVHQDGGGQYIDAGLVSVEERGESSSTSSSGEGVESTQLLGTFPNPAQEEATVRYVLPNRQNPVGAGERVRMQLYDMLGRQVKTLSGKAEAGYHEQTVDVSDLSN